MPGSPSSTPWTVSVPARYVLQRKLGSGAFGSVYLAQDRREGRRVALKVLRPDRLGPRGIERLEREFRGIASLRHPRIAAAFDFGYTDPGRVPFYTREYVEGRPI